jgi:hypothetical protein
MPAEVVSLDLPVDCAFAMLVGDGWFGGTAAARSLAFRDISEGCDIPLVAALTLSPFRDLGPPLKPWPPWPLATILTGAFGFSKSQILPYFHCFDRQEAKI